MTREVEEALRQATDANARSYTHEEVMQAMQERIDRGARQAMLIGYARLDAGSEPGVATRSLEQGRM
jgi:hypothetical protein